ncbi:hypothetical protein [Flavobacterium sp. 120]|uniref:hypothetical protein n=1 Tax=Flavobacterium sp. 120 TaxID=2135626 RepID=UPI000EB3878E|nr:hypothetical protein [Flavobacterium sp. 120]RKS12841.1 hypothetical protein C8C87_0018 [Flavobacterium sp. 120]
MFKIPPFNFVATHDLQSNKAKDNLFKIYLDFDIVFYNLSFDALKEVNTVYEERDLYDQSIAGVSTFLKLQKPNKKQYEYYPAINYERLNINQEYAIITYFFSGAFSTRTIATVQNLTFDKIEMFKYTQE